MQKVNTITKKLRQLIINLFIAQNILIILIAVIATIMLYKWQNNTTKNIADLTRRDLLIGDYRKSILTLSSQLNSVYDYVAYYNSNSEFELILPTNISKTEFSKFIKEGTLYYSTFTFNIYPSSNPEKHIGKIIFVVNQFRYIKFIILIWVFSSLILLCFYYISKNVLTRTHNTEIELQKEAAIGRIINQIAHDLRFYIYPIEYFVQQSGKYEISFLQKQVSIALNRVHGLLDSLRNCDVESIVVKRQNLFNFTNLLSALQCNASLKSKEITFDGPDNLNLYIDAIKFERVISNLVVNALKFARINCWIKIFSSEMDLNIEVIDDGDGVDTAIISNLFNKGMTYNNEDGTGLGLYYSKKVIEAHGGTLTYKRDNDLTKFIITIPDTVINFLDINSKPEIKNSSTNNAEAITLPDSKINKILVIINDPYKYEQCSECLKKYPDVEVRLFTLELQEINLSVYSAVFTTDKLLVEKCIAKNIHVTVISKEITCEKIEEKIRFYKQSF